jgi:hypothetical protein
MSINYEHKIKLLNKKATELKEKHKKMLASIDYQQIYLEAGSLRKAAAVLKEKYKIKISHEQLRTKVQVVKKDIFKPKRTIDEIKRLYFEEYYSIGQLMALGYTRYTIKRVIGDKERVGACTRTNLNKIKLLLDKGMDKETIIKKTKMKRYLVEKALEIIEI